MHQLSFTQIKKLLEMVRRLWIQWQVFEQYFLKMDHSRPLWPLFLPFLHIWWFTKIFLPMAGLEPWNSCAGVDGNQCSSSLIGVSDHICFQKWEKRFDLFLHFSQKERNPENVEHLFDLNICQRWPTFGQKTDTLWCWLVKKLKEEFWREME